MFSKEYKNQLVYLVVSRWFNRQGLGDLKAQIVGVNYSGVT